jgi:hypothetical protein
MNANKQNTFSTITICRIPSSNRARRHQQYKLLSIWISSNAAHGIVNEEKRSAATPAMAVKSQHKQLKNSSPHYD